MGKRQIGDMQPNELVITLLISEIAAIPLQDTSQPLLFGIVAIFILIILEIVVSVIALKSETVRKILNGKSIVVIKNGVIDQKAMQKVRMSVIDLVELLRGQNVFDISTVAFAVLEVNGELSVLLKAPDQPITAKDMQIKKKQEALPLPVISDGKIIKESLSALEISQGELLNKLCLELSNFEDLECYLFTDKQIIIITGNKNERNAKVILDELKQSFEIRGGGNPKICKGASPFLKEIEESLKND